MSQDPDQDHAPPAERGPKISGPHSRVGPDNFQDQTSNPDCMVCLKLFWDQIITRLGRTQKMQPNTYKELLLTVAIGGNVVLGLDLLTSYEAQNLFSRSSLISFDWVKIFDGRYFCCTDKSLIFTDPHYHISEKTAVTTVIQKSSTILLWLAIFLDTILG